MPPLNLNRLAAEIFQYCAMIVLQHPSGALRSIVFFIRHDCYKMIAVVDSGRNGPRNVRNDLIVGVQPSPP